MIFPACQSESSRDPYKLRAPATQSSLIGTAVLRIGIASGVGAGLKSPGLTQLISPATQAP